VTARLQFSVLGSGSRGNCVLVQAGAHAVLLDAGLSTSSTLDRVATLSPRVRPEAILLTHEHSDHIAHVRRLAEETGATVYGSAGTLAATSEKKKLGSVAARTLVAGAKLHFGPLEVEAVTKPHDAREPVGFLVRCGEAVLGFFTDLGHVDANVGAAISACTALILEANHDAQRLANGPYPPWLQARVGGSLGHLANRACMEAIARHAGPQLRELVLAHLSPENNSPELVRNAAKEMLGARTHYARRISLQDRPTPLLDARPEATQPLVSMA